MFMLGGIVGNAGGPFAEFNSLPVNEFFKFTTAITSTLAVAADSQDRDLILVDATGFVVGNTIQIGDSSINSYYPTIISISVNTLTLDRLIDMDADLGEDITVVDINLNANASAGTPRIYILKPPLGIEWFITRMLPAISHSSAGDLGLFGDVASLANGVTIRTKIGGNYGTFTNWKNSSDMKKDMFDVEFDSRSPGGIFGTSGRDSFSRTMVTVRLNGNVGDQLEAMVQDNLSTLLNFNLNGQGYARAA